MLRLKRGDLVEVICGTEKGKRGSVLRVDPRDKKVIVQGLKLVYKHMRRSQKYPQGGRIQKEAAIGRRSAPCASGRLRPEATA